MGFFLSIAITFVGMHFGCYPSKAGYHSRIAIRAFGCLVVLIAFCTAARSQAATGQFDGHVFDQNGAVVPGATITLVDLQTSLSRNTQTNGEGSYEFPLIPPGAYKITTQTGFETASSQTVTVSFSSELLQASTANLGVVVESLPVADLLSTEEASRLSLTLAPGVNPMPYDNIDFSLMKRTHIWKATSVQFRADSSTPSIPKLWHTGRYVWRE